MFFTDVPSHCFQYTFASNPNWSHFFSPGAEIAKYFQSVADKYDLRRLIRFRHLFRSARWLEDRAQWEITILRLEDGLVLKRYCDVFIKATGNLNKWTWPDIAGLENFQGPLIHSANWKNDFDPSGKRVAVIGYGATAVQLVPAILPQVKSMDHYVRGQAWISPAGYVAADTRKAQSDVHNCMLVFSFISFPFKPAALIGLGQSSILMKRERNGPETGTHICSIDTRSRTLSTKLSWPIGWALI